MPETFLPENLKTGGRARSIPCSGRVREMVETRGESLGEGVVFCTVYGQVVSIFRQDNEQGEKTRLLLVIWVIWVIWVYGRLPFGLGLALFRFPVKPRGLAKARFGVKLAKELFFRHAMRKHRCRELRTGRQCGRGLCRQVNRISRPYNTL